MKLMVIPVGRSLVFSGSQAKIFRTLPQMAWGGEFCSDIMWWFGDWTRLILHELPLPRKRGKIFWSLPPGGRSQTPGFFRITGKKYFLLYRSQAQNISYSIDHRQKIRILPKRYFGLYLLVGGRKPYTIWNPIYCKDSWRDYPLP